MKKMFIFILLLLTVSMGAMAQESRKERRLDRDREKAAEIEKLIEKGNLRFLAQFALPMSGGSIHLTSEYTLDIEGNKVTSWLPFYGRAYSVSYNTREGGIKFSETVDKPAWKKVKHGYRTLIEVRTRDEFYSLNLFVSDSGFGTLDVGSKNRQPISFNGIVVKLEDKEEKQSKTP
jgi:hypothetical protein